MKRVRRLPVCSDGRHAVFVTADGGRLDDIADSLEQHLLDVARKDDERAAGLAKDGSASVGELKIVLGVASATILRLIEMVENG